MRLDEIFHEQAELLSENEVPVLFLAAGHASGQPGSGWVFQWSPCGLPRKFPLKSVTENLNGDPQGYDSIETHAHRQLWLCS